MRTLTRTTIVDLTDDLRRFVAASGLSSGCAIGYCIPPNCALSIASTDYEFEDMGLRPLCLGSRSISIPVADGRPLLGKRQRLIMIVDGAGRPDVLWHAVGK